MKILVIAPSWIGDLMMSQTLYRCLKSHSTQAVIDVIAPEWCRPLLLKMPEVNQILPFSIGHGQLILRQRYAIGIKLRKNNYQQAIVLPNSFKSALIPFFARIPKRTGWRGEMRYGLLNDLRILDSSQLPLLVQRYAALAYHNDQINAIKQLPTPLPRPQLQVTPEELAHTKVAFALPHNRPIIGLCPGSALDITKRWPHYHYATLATALVSRGYHVALLGSANDRPICTTIQQQLPANLQNQCLNYAGKTLLIQVIALIAHCQAIISNDSGLMHIAAALDRPLIALYGPTNTAFTPPLSPKAKIIHLSSGHDTVATNKPFQGYHHTLIHIQPEQVLRELETLLGKQDI